jgi:hypothetical protein
VGAVSGDVGWSRVSNGGGRSAGQHCAWRLAWIALEPRESGDRMGHSRDPPGNMERPVTSCLLRITGQKATISLSNIDAGATFDKTAKGRRLSGKRCITPPVSWALQLQEFLHRNPRAQSDSLCDGGISCNGISPWR